MYSRARDGALSRTKGTRRINGQEYFLAGRGSGVRMAQEAKTLRQDWERVCIRAYGRDGVMLDD